MPSSCSLPPVRCLINRRYGDKAACLSDLAALVAPDLGLDHQELLAALLRRETLGSTGVGAGVALPHARLSSIETPAVVLARLRKAIPFDAVDQLPVDIVCLLVLRDEPAGGDMSLLAGCARALRDKRITDTIRAAPTPEAIAEAMTFGFVPGKGRLLNG